jgi:hypothetical protein
MTDNLAVTPGTGATVLADEVTDGTLGSGLAGFCKIMDGTLDSTNKLVVSAGGAAKVDGSAVTQPVSGSVTVTQGTGTNLHAVVDSGSITCTQATGTNLHAVIDSGTITTVTNAVTVSQATGSNLHAVLDSGTTTVTQGTGTNLHAVVDSGSITCTQGTGTNLHAVVDSGSITCTQGTGTNLHAVIDSGAVTATDSVVAATFVVKTVDYSASATAQTLWQPAGGKKFVICDLIVAGNAAGTITLFDATDNTTLRVAKAYLAANGGFVKSYRKPYISAAAENILKYTSDSTATGSITVSGYEV